jgi:hypothetical protein
MSEHDTPSTLFTLRTRTMEGQKYEDRAVNMAFENTHVPLFKVVPPSVGSFIYMECKYRIDAIAYYKGKIVLCLTDASFII